MEGYRPQKRYAELIRLLEDQVEARETAIFVGLTDAELCEYDRAHPRVIGRVRQTQCGRLVRPSGAFSLPATQSLAHYR